MPRGHVLLLDSEAPTYRAALLAAYPQLTVHAATTAAAAMPVAAGCDVLIGLAPAIPASLVAAMPGLRFLQALTTGVDNLLPLPLPPGAVLASARGIHGPQMSELAFLHMLALARRFPDMLRNQQAAHWQRWKQRLLFGKTVLILGVGVIGEALAVRCQAFGMRVLGLSARATAPPGFDQILPRAQLTDAVAMADFLVVLVPYTPQNHHLVGRAVFDAMRPDSLLIDLSRGHVVDEAALLDALGSGRIAGAALDVFATEPLPPSSPLWHAPNLIITPHIGGMSDCYPDQVLPIVLGNLGHYLAGDPDRIANRIDRDGALA